MATWQGALVCVENIGRLRDVGERYRIVVSGSPGPWLLIDVAPQLGRLGPPAFAQSLSKDLKTSVIAFFVQTSVSNERIEHWDNGELSRELEYYADGGGWIAQRGTPQAWEQACFLPSEEWTRDSPNWPGNLADGISREDVARYEEARRQRTPAPVMDLLVGGSMVRLCRFFGVDPKQPGGYYRSPPNWRVGGTLIAVALLFASACALGYVYR